MSDKSADSALLLVFAEPGKDVTLEEFQDWYDNEHVPLRTERFPEFRSAARYQVLSTVASSSDRPYTASGWAAIYNISSLSLFNDDHPYAALRTPEGRSQREAELLSRIAILDRRIYRLTYDSGTDSKYHAQVKDSLRPLKADETAPAVVATSVTPADGNQQAYDEWYLGEHVEALSKVPGWRRTRRFDLVDALIIGKEAAPNNGDAASVPKCLGLHEYDSGNFSSTPEFSAALNTPWRTRVMREDGSGIAQQERKVMDLYRAWDPTAALKAGH
ncbi:Coatomer subunit beta' [Tilletia horrida]|uniref:Coatomer subunit beta n=1 Tax=Tilletia horrida TaxID=155126 RepID=A0AAN6GPI3_9BASI|nr:Coatomer subunit beta' [Tilletia horrida]